MSELDKLTQLAELQTMPEEDKVISLRIFMPESLKNSFKAVCAKQGKNMSEVVNDFAKGYVNEFESSNKKI